MLIYDVNGEPLVIATAGFSQARRPSCCPNNSVRAP